MNSDIQKYKPGLQAIQQQLSIMHGLMTTDLQRRFGETIIKASPACSIQSENTDHHFEKALTVIVPTLTKLRSTR
jgi:hypothetical protein